MTLSIGGKDYALNFGVNWFYEFYKQDSGHDLIKDPSFTLKDTGSTEVFSVIQSLMWAGYKSECRVNKQPEELLREDIENHVMGCDTESVVNTLWELIACISGTSVESLKETAVDAEKKNQIAAGTT